MAFNRLLHEIISPNDGHGRPCQRAWRGHCGQVEAGHGHPGARLGLRENNRRREERKMNWTLHWWSRVTNSWLGHLQGCPLPGGGWLCWGLRGACPCSWRLVDVGGGGVGGEGVGGVLEGRCGAVGDRHPLQLLPVLSQRVRLENKMEIRLFCYSREFEIEKASNWNLLTKSISLASTLPPSPPASSLPFNMMMVILIKVILMKTTLTWIVLGNENVHEQVINREQKQNKTFAFASFLYPPNIWKMWTSIKTVIGKREELLWIKFEKSFNKQ